MKNRFLFLFIVFAVPFTPLFSDVFTAAGVQYRIDIENYHSSESFFNDIDRITREIYSNEDPDIIIFPEYIGVFYQLIEYNRFVKAASTFQEALTAVLAENPRVNTLADVFSMSSSVISYIEGWSCIAERYNVVIVAGSCFITDEKGDLKNRCFVFDAGGKMLYRQDKVYLTDFESEIIGLTPGAIDSAGFFSVEGKKIAITICRDTYSRTWEKKNSGAFLWIDIKANGERYTLEQQQSFKKALPMRLANTAVDHGMTVCAVGSYLDLLWEGESSAVFKTGGRLAVTDVSEDCKNGDYIILRIDTEQ